MRSATVRNVMVHNTPRDPRAYQITFELKQSRRTITFGAVRDETAEPKPHGAGSFHNPDQHHVWMDAVDAMLREFRQDEGDW